MPRAWMSSAMPTTRRQGMVSAGYPTRTHLPNASWPGQTVAAIAAPTTMTRSAPSTDPGPHGGEVIRRHRVEFELPELAHRVDARDGDGPTGRTGHGYRELQ